MYNIIYNFSRIDNEEEAYILGFLLADGHILGRPSYRLGFQLAAKDLYMVEKIKNYICPDCKIWKEKNNTYKFQICRREIVENLYSLGFEENKTSKEIKIPSMREDLNRHFIRGYFDGDGALIFDRSYMYAYICSPTIEILQSIKIILENNNIGSKIHTQLRKGKQITVPGGTTIAAFDQYRLNIQNRSDMEKLYEFLYRNSNIHLTRKYEKFSTWLSTKIPERKTKSLLERI